MASNEDREKHKRRRINHIAKDLRSPDGKYKLKVIDPRKEEYKRIKLDPRTIDLDNEEFENEP
jgi:hypothetical protein